MFTTFIAAIGYSRVYVGSHSFNQVMLGWVLGIYSLYIYIKYEVKYDEN
jgi:membrane-associated phospholipid phosphatase